MNTMVYEAYKEWRARMVLFQDDLAWDEQTEADFAIWDAADHEARDDFNLFLAAKTLDQVSFTEMKEMEIRYEIEN